MSPAQAAELCEYHGEHGRIDERLSQLEGREDKQDDRIRELKEGQGGIREEIAGMRGEIRGALSASRVSGAVIGALVSVVGSGLLAFLGYLLTRGG